MPRNEKRLIPLAEAAELYGMTDLTAFKRACRRFGVLVITEGLPLVDYDEFVIQVDKSANAKLAATPKTKQKNSPARKIAILRARLSRYPTLIEDNEHKLRFLQSEKVGETKYDKYAQKKKIEAQNSKIDQMKGNAKRDQEELDRLLNMDWGNSDEADSGDGSAPISPNK